MKRQIIALTLLFATYMGFAQTQATQFKTADCKSVSHDLFAELDSGYVVILDFVMPCGTCIAPSLSAYNVAKSYASSNPGKIKFYLCDDYGNSTCSTISSWGTTNGITSPDATFSSTSVVESAYGSGGMPKIVLLSGKTHQVYYTSNGSAFNATTFKSQVDFSIVASTSGVKQNVINLPVISIYPNPASHELNITSTTDLSSAKTEVMNSLGEIISLQPIINGKNVHFNCSGLTDGIYFIRLTTKEGIINTRFTVAN